MAKAKLKKRTAYKVTDYYKNRGLVIGEVFSWKASGPPVIYGFEKVGDVETNGGPMILAKMLGQARVDLATPDLDVIAKIGSAEIQVHEKAEDGTLKLLNTMAYDLYLQGEKYYIKAVDELGIYYYHSKCHLFYEVTINNAHEIVLANAEASA